MTFLDLMGGIGQGYINNLPNIKDMERLAITIGCSVEYKHGFCVRWQRWVRYYDCEYTLTRNYDDMRGYTS